MYKLNPKNNKVNESYMINDVAYNIKVQNKHIKINKSQSNIVDKNFDDVASFIQFALGNTFASDWQSKLFPLHFCINKLDSF